MPKISWRKLSWVAQIANFFLFRKFSSIWYIYASDNLVISKALYYIVSIVLVCMQAFGGGN